MVLALLFNFLLFFKHILLFFDRLFFNLRLYGLLWVEGAQMLLVALFNVVILRILLFECLRVSYLSLSLLTRFYLLGVVVDGGLHPLLILLFKVSSIMG